MDSPASRPPGFRKLGKTEPVDLAGRAQRQRLDSDEMTGNEGLPELPLAMTL